jgi:hypothetical protein
MFATGLAHAQVQGALALPVGCERMIGLGLVPVGSPPPNSSLFVVAQTTNIAKIGRSAGIEPP